MTDNLDNQFTAIATGIYLEGLATDPLRDMIWYSDVMGGGIHGIRPDGTKLYTFNADRMWTGGVLVNHDGAVLSTGAGGIMWNNPESGRQGWLLDQIDGQPINGVNEMVSDGAGGIFFGTTDIEMVIKGERTRPTAIYRLTADRELILAAEGIGFTNGIMFDGSRSRLYCNDTFTGTWCFDVGDDLTLSDRTKVIDKEDVDGMALDAEGNLWITGFRSSFVTRISPEGKELDRFETPAGSITQVRFGGADGRDLYINSVPSDGGDTLKEGGEMSANNSFLYKTRAPVAGWHFASPRFSLD